MNDTQITQRPEDSVKPQDEKPLLHSNRRLVAAEYHYEGPLPPPKDLAQYNEIIPNGAERILAMAEQQSRHRMEMENKVVTGNMRSQSRGSLYAFLLAMVALVGGIFLIHEGKSASGLATVITCLGGLVSVFAYSQYKQGRERAGKSSALAERQKQ